MPPSNTPARLAVLLLLGLLVACAAPSGPVGGPSCAAELSGRGAAFEALAERRSQNGCQLADGVRIARSSVALDQPVQLNCAMAIRLLRFETDIVEPAAQRHFGQRLARLRHFGGYSCRPRADNARRMSEHALGNAIDVSGFDLADGTQITIGRHWNEAGPRGAFLHEVARGACSVFHVVLTPRTDALHRSHFHLDLGPWRRCDA